ncbi:hypothetical protein TcWFU_000718 [Taenia crassiceps]|uniref:Uncharacterized protein n=1 Tax=Taenia crassiceps TaxID=6207 RepID=A0ABR4Q9X8_9CEST
MQADIPWNEFASPDYRPLRNAPPSTRNTKENKPNPHTSWYRSAVHWYSLLPFPRPNFQAASSRPHPRCTFCELLPTYYQGFTPTCSALFTRMNGHLLDRTHNMDTDATSTQVGHFASPPPPPQTRGQSICRYV